MDSDCILYFYRLGIHYVSSDIWYFFEGRGSENYLDLYRKEHIRLHTEQNEKIGELVDLLKEKL